MPEHSADAETAQSVVESRRVRIEQLLGELPPCVAEGGESASGGNLAHLREDAEELYWNELSWEELTDEEAVPGGHLTEMVFPGFLAFVDGLLVREVPADSIAPANPRPDAVEEILRFLGERYASTTSDMESGADSEKLVWARAMTSRLIDLVLYRLYRLGPGERARLDEEE
ncbi:MAG: hypothetical protein ACREKN_02445 [Longimicrobiaceae bacterium]